MQIFYIKNSITGMFWSAPLSRESWTSEREDSFYYTEAERANLQLTKMQRAGFADLEIEPLTIN